MRCQMDGVAPASVRAMRAQTVSVMAIAATVTGLLAIVRVLPREVAGLWPLGFLCGVAGLVLAILERSAISRGASPASGRRPATVALAVSVVHAIFIALFFFAIAVSGFLEGFSRR